MESLGQAGGERFISERLCLVFVFEALEDRDFDCKVCLAEQQESSFTSKYAGTS